jgi:prolyl 4-hydroxylase
VIFIDLCSEKYIPDYRKSDRCIVDSDALAAELWERIKHVVPLERNGEIAVGLNERFRFLRYDPGDFFERHRDGTYMRGLEKGPEHKGECSRITVQIYLSFVEEGGATTVYSDFGEERYRVGKKSL